MSQRRQLPHDLRLNLLDRWRYGAVGVALRLAAVNRGAVEFEHVHHVVDANARDRDVALQRCPFERRRRRVNEQHLEPRDACFERRLPARGEGGVGHALLVHRRRGEARRRARCLHVRGRGQVFEEHAFGLQRPAPAGRAHDLGLAVLRWAHDGALRAGRGSFLGHGDSLVTGWGRGWGCSGFVPD